MFFRDTQVAANQLTPSVVLAVDEMKALGLVAVKQN